MRATNFYGHQQNSTAKDKIKYFGSRMAMLRGNRGGCDLKRGRNLSPGTWQSEIVKLKAVSDKRTRKQTDRQTVGPTDAEAQTQANRWNACPTGAREKVQKSKQNFCSWYECQLTAFCVWSIFFGRAQDAAADTTSMWLPHLTRNPRCYSVSCCCCCCCNCCVCGKKQFNHLTWLVNINLDASFRWHGLVAHLVSIVYAC